MLAGPIYALVALAFVVVYKASRMINFALGEWTMLGSRLVAMGLQAPALGLGGALGVACAGMIAVGVAFNRVVVQRLVGQPLTSLIMVTLGLGALMRGSTPLAFSGVPAAIPLPIPREALVLQGVTIATDKLVAATVAAAAIVVLMLFFHGTRAGVALRAIADDPQIAMSMGIDVGRYLSGTWAMVGVLSVLAGTLWTFVSGGGFGVVLVGLRVFPIVIIGGLDSIPGTIVGAVFVGMLESLAAGYVDPIVGGGFSNVVSYLVLIVVLFVRPYGLFGRADTARV